MVEIEFMYNGKSTIIQSQKETPIKELINKFTSKLNIDENSLFFIYNGNIIEKSLSFSSIANNYDKERNKMSLLVFEGKDPKEKEKEKEKKLIRLRQVICPICQENIRIKIENYKIDLFDCKNGHKIRNILLSDYDKTQNVDESKIKCDICKTNDKASAYNNIFYICLDCNQKLCPLCKSSHEKIHKNIINYDDKYYICSKHNELYNSYCNDCKKNICLLCENGDEHNKHNIILFSKIMQNKEQKLNEIYHLKESITQFKENITDIIHKLNNLVDNINLLYEISENIINNYDIKKRNYEILKNMDYLMEIK